MRAKSILSLFATSLFVASCQTAAADQPEVVHVVRLEHAHANIMAPTLQQFASGTELTIAAAPGQNALLIRGSQEQVNQTLELVARLDLPNSPQKSPQKSPQQKSPQQPSSDTPEPNNLANAIVIHCQHCKAKDLAKTIQQMLPRASRRGGTEQVIVAPHVEHNALLLSGPTEKVDQVRKLVEKLDRKAS